MPATLLNALKKPAAIFFVLSTLLFLSTYLITGFYYETNDDFAMDYSLRGLMGLPIHDFYICLHGITRVLSWLYGLFPGIPFYSLILYFLLLLSVLNIFLLLNRVVELSWWKKISVLCLFYYLFLLENIMYFNFTRVAILLCATSVLQLIFSSTEKRNPVLLFYYSSLLFIGALLRPQAFYLSCLIVFPSVFLIEYYRAEWRNLVFPLSLSGFILCAFNVVIFVLDAPDVTAYINLTAYVTDYHVIDPSRIMNSREQVYYDGIYQWFFADSRFFSFNALQGFIERKSYGLFYFGLNKLIFSLKMLTGMLVRNYFAFLTMNAILLVSFLYSSFERKSFLYLWNAYVWGLLILISVLFKSEDRVVCPVLVIYTLVNLLFIFKQVHEFRHKRASLTLLLVIFLLYSVKLIHRVQFSSERKIENAAALESIRQTAGSSPYVVATIVGRYFTFLDPFHQYECGLEGKLIRLCGWLAVFPENHQMIERAAGKDSLPALFEYCRKNKIPFIATQSEVDFLAEYCKIFYSKYFVFEKGRDKVVSVYYLKDL